MDEFTERLQGVDVEALKESLLNKKSPSYESELLKIAFPGFELRNTDPLLLYQSHFLLFHVLYKLQNEFNKDNKYLYVHFMRTLVTDYPDIGRCRFFDEHLTSFCNTNCDSDNNYCEFHEKLMGETEIEELSARYFYLDQENFYKLDKDTAEAFMRGTWETLRYYKEYKESFEILGLHESADIDEIKKRFRMLAKECHPDLGGRPDSNERFNRINRAYRLLLQIRSLYKSDG